MNSDGVRVGQATDPRAVDLNFRGLRDAAFLTGKIGGQVFFGGVTGGEHLTLHSNPSKNGLIKLGDSSALNEANGRFGIGTTSPTVALDVRGVIQALDTVNGGPNAQVQFSGGAGKIVYDVNGGGVYQITMARSRAGGACIASELLGDFAWNGKNSSAVEKQLAILRARFTTVTAGAEASDFQLYTTTAGVLSEKLRVDNAAAANSTSLLVTEGSPATLRRAQWKDYSNLIAGDRVMVLV